MKDSFSSLEATPLTFEDTSHIPSVSISATSISKLKFPAFTSSSAVDGINKASAINPPINVKDSKFTSINFFIS